MTDSVKLMPRPLCGEPIEHTESDDPQFYFECTDKRHCGMKFNIHADSEKMAFGCMNNRPTPAVTGAEYQRVLAEAALCILENPYDAITDTIWLRKDEIGPTLFEHLVGYLDINIEGTQEDNANQLREFIEKTRTLSAREGE